MKWYPRPNSKKSKKPPEFLRDAVGRTCSLCKDKFETFRAKPARDKWLCPDCWAVVSAKIESVKTVEGDNHG